jgi:hypothetical protein
MHTVGASTVEEQGVEAPAVDEETTERPELAAQGNVALPLDQRRAARPEAGRGNRAVHAKQLQLWPNADA